MLYGSNSGEIPKLFHVYKDQATCYDSDKLKDVLFQKRINTYRRSQKKKIPKGDIYPDEVAHNLPPHLDRHCLPSGL